MHKKLTLPDSKQTFQIHLQRHHDQVPHQRGFDCRLVGVQDFGQHLAPVPE